MVLSFGFKRLFPVDSLGGLLQILCEGLRDFLLLRPVERHEVADELLPRGQLASRRFERLLSARQGALRNDLLGLGCDGVGARLDRDLSKGCKSPLLYGLHLGL
jgi:hypothetical protein